MAHKGFYERTNRFYESLERLLERYSRLNLPLIFTGHSMCGALAQISALQFKLKYRDVLASVITFGCPKSCDPMLAKHFENTIGLENHARIITEDSNYEDIVTKQPPSFKVGQDPIYEPKKQSVFSVLRQILDSMSS